MARFQRYLRERDAKYRGLTLKDLYDEAAEARKHFLSWRQALFGGYFAILLACVKLALDALEKTPEASFLILMAASVIGLLFQLIALRTRGLYSTADRCLALLEEGTRTPLHLALSRLRDNGPWPPGVHALAESAVYLGFSAFLLLVAFQL